jgi:hypothetical protein
VGVSHICHSVLLNLEILGSKTAGAHEVHGKNYSVFLCVLCVIGFWTLMEDIDPPLVNPHLAFVSGSCYIGYHPTDFSNQTVFRYEFS